MHGAALRHRQAVAQAVVAPVPGGPDAEARHPDQTAPDRHPVAELRLQPPARRREPPSAIPAIVSRPQRAWAPLSACPPQDGVSFARKPSGVDGVGL